MDPLGAVASGALLMAVHAKDADAICSALEAEGISAYRIGHVESGPANVIDTSTEPRPLPRPERDEVLRLFE